MRVVCFRAVSPILNLDLAVSELCSERGTLDVPLLPQTVIGLCQLMLNASRPPPN
jgi:hypothetical protein